MVQNWSRIRVKSVIQNLKEVTMKAVIVSFAERILFQEINHQNLI